MMKAAIFFSIFLMFTPLVLAEDAPKYNFGTTAAAGTISMEPGQTMKAPAINFFNIYGNRITHVTLTLVEIPKGWNVKIEPELHEVQVNISGTIVTSTENLYASPSQAIAEIPAIPVEGSEYIRMGGIEGYVPAKVAYLNITVPPGTPLGGSYRISVKAIGSWYGQTANVALSQERTFNFDVKTVTHSFSEEVVVQKEKTENTDYTMYIAVVVMLVVAIGGYYAGKRKK